MTKIKIEKKLQGPILHTFYVRNLRMFVISLSDFPYQAFPAQSMFAVKARSLTLNTVPKRDLT